MSNLNIDFQLISQDFDSKLKRLTKENPGIIRAGARSVNRAVIKDVKREFASRGYLPHKAESWGDAGFQGKGNVAQDVHKDLSAKIWFSSAMYHYKFVEYGANVKWRHRRGNFTLLPKPALTPIADEYWQTDKAAKVIEAYAQKQYDKINGGK